LIEYESPRYQRSLALRVAVNREILTKGYWTYPFEDGHEGFRPVGRGPIPENKTGHGSYHGLKVCGDLDSHEGKVLRGEDYTGKPFVRLQHWYCHDPNCPICWIRGWSVRGARDILDRLKTGQNLGLGKKFYSVMVSVPPELANLPEAEFRVLARRAMRRRGIIGGCDVFHAFRNDWENRFLPWSPHYHTNVFVKGDIAEKCRGCSHQRGDCASCSGFKGRQVRAYKKDRFIVKLMDERKTEFGTIWYMLNHASVNVSFLKRNHVWKWSGVCGNRKFKTVKSASFDSCYVCGGETEDAFYVGKRPLVKDVGSPLYKPFFPMAEFDEDGNPNYVLKVGRGEVGYGEARFRRRYSGSYEGGSGSYEDEV